MTSAIQKRITPFACHIDVSIAQVLQHSHSGIQFGNWQFADRERPVKDHAILTDRGFCWQRRLFHDESHPSVGLKEAYEHREDEAREEDIHRR